MADILVIGSLRDPHVGRVVAEIERQSGPETIVLDALSSTETSFAVHADGSFELRVGGRRLERPLLLWDRQKILLGSLLTFAPDEGDPHHAKWRKAEWMTYARMISGVFGSSVVNSLASRMCLAKPYQQILAAASGFLVPETLVANRKAPIAEFVEQRASIIKTLSAESISDDPTAKRSVVLTMAVPSESLARAAEIQFTLAPQFVQQNVAKQYELRVLVIDQEILAFRVMSQRFASSRTDWRGGSQIAKFEPWSVSDTVAASLHRFMRLTGLFSGSFDLIVDPDDGVWFLECNQDGQWGWLDDLVDGAVTRCFARALTARARARSLCAGSVNDT